MSGWKEFVPLLNEDLRVVSSEKSWTLDTHTSGGPLQKVCVCMCVNTSFFFFFCYLIKKCSRRRREWDLSQIGIDFDDPTVSKWCKKTRISHAIALFCINRSDSWGGIGERTSWKRERQPKKEPLLHLSITRQPTEKRRRRCWVARRDKRPLQLRRRPISFNTRLHLGVRGV